MKSKKQVENELMFKEKRIQFWEKYHQIMPETEERIFNTINKSKMVLI
jgi:hypothetical protein